MSAQNYITKALDNNNEPTFDWSNAYEFIPIFISESVSEAIGNRVTFDATHDGITRFLDIWPGGETYVDVDQDGSLNSFGQPEDHIALDVTGFQGWSGLGFRATSDSQTPWENVIDDTWVFHFAMKSIDNAAHRFGIGGNNATFTIGDTEFEGGQVIGNIPRDGEWYYIDIPYSVIRQLADIVWAYHDGSINFLTILSGGVQGTQLRLDNIFWYKTTTSNEYIDENGMIYQLDDVNNTAKVIYGNHYNSFTFISIPNKVTKDGVDYIVNAIASSAFDGCNLDELSIYADIENGN